MHRRIRRLGSEDDDPLAGVANFFDLGVVFALGFLLAFVTYLGLPELLSRQEITLVKNAGTPEMEIIRRKGTVIKKYRVSRDKLWGEGQRLGIAYQLKTGEVIYVPEEDIHK